MPTVGVVIYWMSNFSCCKEFTYWVGGIIILYFYAYELAVWIILIEKPIIFHTISIVGKKYNFYCLLVKFISEVSIFIHK